MAVLLFHHDVKRAKRENNMRYKQFNFKRIGRCHFGRARAVNV